MFRLPHVLAVMVLFLTLAALPMRSAAQTAATVNVYVAGTNQNSAASRAYARPNTNPTVLIDATMYVYSLDTGKPVDQGRTYASANSNPRTFEVPPGRYRVEVNAIRLDGRPERQIELTVEAGQTTERTVDFWG